MFLGASFMPLKISQINKNKKVWSRNLLTDLNLSTKEKLLLAPSFLDRAG